MPYWTRRVSFADRIVMDNVDTSLMELSLHGRLVWNEHAYSIITASQNIIEYMPKFYHWENARNFCSNFEPEY
jgi:hypothetical protein